MCERWVGNWTNCNILTPSSVVFRSTSFSFCWAAPSGVLRAHSPLRVLVLSTASYLQLDWLQLTEPVCLTGFYNCLSSIYFWWVSHLHPIQLVHSQGIFDRMHMFRNRQLGRRSICYSITNSLRQDDNRYSNYENTLIEWEEIWE